MIAEVSVLWKVVVFGEVLVVVVVEVVLKAGEVEVVVATVSEVVVVVGE
jgi:hypothetical protein